MFRRDARHSGLTADAVAPPLRLAWVTHTGGTILTSSAAVAHDTVFIGVRDEDGTAGNGVVALDLATGRPRWRAHTPGAVHASVAVAGDLVLAAPVRGPLCALEVGTGRRRWAWRPDDPATPRCWMYYSLTIDGATAYHAYVTDGGAGIAALDAGSGRLRWLYDTPGPPLLPDGTSAATPAVAGGVVYAAFTDGSVTALDLETGEDLWRHHTEGAVVSSPAVSGQHVYVGSHDGRLRALDLETGECRWAYDLGARVASSPVVTGNTVIAATWDGNVYAFTGT